MAAIQLDDGVGGDLVAAVVADVRRETARRGRLLGYIDAHDSR